MNEQIRVIFIQSGPPELWFTVDVTEENVAKQKAVLINLMLIETFEVANLFRIYPVIRDGFDPTNWHAKTVFILFL